MPTYDTPGVYIEEQTGPGVIAGVGTSTAAFIGPARRGPLRQAVRVSSYEEFLAQFAISMPDGTIDPYITSPRWFYMAFAVKGFFQNGGTQAFIVRVGTGTNARWTANNQGGQAAFRLQAKAEGLDGNNLAVETQAANATGAAGVAAAVGSATVTNVTGLNVTVDNVSPFRVGDWVTEDQAARARITAIATATKVLTLTVALPGLANGDTLRIAHLIPAQQTLRLAATTGLFPGSVVLIRGRNPADTADVENYSVVESVDAAGFVTFASAPARADTFNLALAAAPALISQELRLIVTPTGGTAESYDNLSLDPNHPGYIFSAVNSPLVAVEGPTTPPTTAGFPGRLVAAAVLPRTDGIPDDLASLSSGHFEAGLNVLRDIDDVNLVCIPDAADHPECTLIQKAMIDHCVDPTLRDRFAILDSRRGAPPSGPGSVEEQRANVESPNGFAALYYPWLKVRDPKSKKIPPDNLLIPPSGHIAGVFARTDQERGVHKAPANTDVRGGILGLEIKLSDGQQGPLNLAGVNVLRIFPGSNTVIVWGARTTVQKDVTDWLYVPVRRLLLYIEESIEEGIRFAVFEPNNLALWQKLKRTISEFLTRVWRDGALFGDKAEQAFQVRIDEALNPPSTRALGRLYIEISVAAVRPAEFIIVRIGLWDGGSDVSEG